MKKNYDKINTILMSLKLLKQALISSHQNLFEKFEFNAIAECNTAQSLIKFYKSNKDFKHFELIAYLEKKLNDTLNKYSNFKTFNIFVNFLIKFKKLIALLSQYLMQLNEKNQQNLLDLFESNHKLIDLVNDFISHTIQIFFFEENNRRLIVRKSNNMIDYFVEKQNQFTLLIENIRLPKQMLKDIGFENFIVRLGKEIIGVQDLNENQNEGGGGDGDNQSMSSATFNKLDSTRLPIEREIEVLLTRLRNTLIKANELYPSPNDMKYKLNELIRKIKAEVKTIDRSTLSNYSSDVTKLINDVDNYSKRINEFNYYSLLVPNFTSDDIEIGKIATEQLIDNSKKSNAVQHMHDTEIMKALQNELKKVQTEFDDKKLIEKNMENYRALLRKNVKLKTWKDLFKKLYDNNVDGMLDVVQLVSDDLYLKLKSTNNNDPKSIASEIYISYAFFRLNIFDEKKINTFFNNYDLVKSTCKSSSDYLNDFKSNVSLLNLYELLKQLCQLYSSVKYELKFYSKDASFIVLPFYLEYTDLIAIIQPNQHLITEYFIKSMYNGACDARLKFDDLFISDDYNCDYDDQIQDSMGLLSYIDHNTKLFIS